MESRVVGLYVHGPKSSLPEDTAATPMVELETVEAVSGMGLRQDGRYFRRAPDAHERKRQVSLIDEGTIWRLEKSFGPISRDEIKAQIVLEGDVFLPARIGSSLRFQSGAELRIAVPRKPCYAMDLITQGLRGAMQDGQQGALAVVLTSGVISLGDRVALEAEPAEALAEAEGAPA